MTVKRYPTDFAGASLSAAFASLVSGDTLAFDPGVYEHDDQLVVSGEDITIDGDFAELRSTNPAKAALTVRNSKTVRLLALNLSGSPVKRLANDGSCGILVEDSSDIVIGDSQISQFAGAGILIQRTSDFIVLGSLILNTRADSIHITDRSSQGIIECNTVKGCGDDGVACIGYMKHGGIIKDIRITGNHIYGNTNGRGVAIEGAEDIDVWDNYIYGTSSAGIIVSSNQTYNTYGVRDVRIRRNQLCAVNYKESVNHGAILLTAREGLALTEEGEYVSLGIHDVEISDNDIFQTVGGSNHIRVTNYSTDVIIDSNRIHDTHNMKKAFGFYRGSQVKQSNNTYNGDLIQ